MFKAPSYIDVFAGAGGISLGLFKAGWTGIFAIEKSKMAFETLKYNLVGKKNHFEWPEWLPLSELDIDHVLNIYEENLKNLQGSIDLVAGGPPCQGFSVAGRRNRNDERNKLVHSYIEFIKLVRPRVILLENVTGFKTGFTFDEIRERAYSDYVSEKLTALNYSVDHKIINFSDYGVPQRRRRFILVGFQENKGESFFNLLQKKKRSFLFKKRIGSNQTTGDAISDLEKKHGTLQASTEKFKYGVYGPKKTNFQKYIREDWEKNYPDSHRFANHRTSTIKRSQYILDNCPRNVDIGEKVRNMYNLKKHTIVPMDKNSQSPTLTTLPDDLIHYSEPRILTVREYARIQTFPDWYEIRNKYTTGGERRRFEIPRYTQIGNAVPPLFVELAGVVLKELI